MPTDYEERAKARDESLRAELQGFFQDACTVRVDRNGNAVIPANVLLTAIDDMVARISGK